MLAGDDAALDAPGSFAIVLDRELGVVRATDSATTEGARSGGRVEAAVRAIAREVAQSGEEATRVVVEPERGRHWILRGRRIQDEPWRARIVGFDATAAVDESRRTFIPTLVHEIRNLGFGLRSILEALALEAPTGDLLATYVAHMRGSFDRLALLGDRLLAFASPPPIARSRVELAAMVDDAVERARPALAATECSALLDLPSEPVFFEGDGARLAAALAAVIENAAHHGPPSSAVRIRARRAGERVEIAVYDGGTGPAGDERAEMWEPLFRRHGSGVGLGLTLARALVVAHGGEVFVERSETGLFGVGMRLPAGNGGVEGQR